MVDQDPGWRATHERRRECHNGSSSCSADSAFEPPRNWGSPTSQLPSTLGRRHWPRGDRKGLLIIWAPTLLTLHPHLVRRGERSQGPVLRSQCRRQPPVVSRVRLRCHRLDLRWGCQGPATWKSCRYAPGGCRPPPTQKIRRRSASEIENGELCQSQRQQRRYCPPCHACSPRVVPSANSRVVSEPARSPGTRSELQPGGGMQSSLNRVANGIRSGNST